MTKPYHFPLVGPNKFPVWQNEFEAVILVVDVLQLPQLVEAAEAAIFLRHQSLSDGSDSYTEMPCTMLDEF